MKKKTPEEKTREGLNSIKEKINKVKEDKRARRAVIIAAAAFVALVVFVVLLFSIRIKNINVTGELAAYNETRVATASEVDIGKSLLLRSSCSIKKSIRKNIPLADEIKVRKNIFTGDVNIEISFLPFDYYIKYKDSYYAVDENLVVVDIRQNQNDFASLGGTYIEIPKVCRPIFGEELVFYDTVPNPDGERETPVPEEDLVDKSEYQYIYDALKAFRESLDYSTLTRVDLDEKYDVVAVYGENNRIQLGGMSSFELKLNILNEILSDESWQHTGFGEIDLRDPSAATARAVKSIDEDDNQNGNEADGSEK